MSRQVERQVVALGRRLEALVRRRLLVRDQPRVGDLQPESHHRAVRRMLLHRLERERVVQHVDVVHQHDLLQPLARQGVPPAEPVDHERVARSVAEVERLVRHPLDVEGVRLAAPPRTSPLGPRGARTTSTSPPRCRAASRSGVSSPDPLQERREVRVERAPPRRPVMVPARCMEVDGVSLCGKRLRERPRCCRSSPRRART